MSNGDQALNFLYLLGCLVLVGSGLAVRRLPLGKSVRMVLAWLLIFAAVFIVFALKDDFLALGRRLLADLRDDRVVETSGAEIRIRRAEDGHFWVDGELNGRPVRFLVDSGATVTTISGDTAERVGIARDAGFGVMVDTANGATLVDRGRAERVRIGPIERGGLAVHIARGESIDVIGMNFLSTLSAWGVEGSTLRLKS
ncbi:MAG TPA: TIGR02281 family clan AA aspartic protease [Allosphingosinicella sp.]|nr:TIGR02281 family clan AA aspartic protease [Allosphingosinicella sp.]